ncbi:MAG: glycosyltransferase family 4 protein [Burkholderiaceae bacterium]
MRILFHHRIRSKDGQYVHLEELLKAFRAEGHEVRLVGPEVVESEQFGADAGWVDALRRWLPAWASELLEFAYNLAALPRLQRAIDEFEPDFIYERFNLFFPVGAWAARRRGVPLASEINAPLFEERSEHGKLSLSTLARWSQGYVWRQADLCLPVTEVLARSVHAYGAERERILVMPNGVDRERFHPTDRDLAKERLALSGRLVLGFVGFVRSWHGVDHVIRLLASGALPENAFLLMVGDGPARAELEALARELGVAERVRFTGVVQRDALAPFLDAIDIALQPAVTAYASPLKLIEYLAMGKAIVAPAQENILELLGDGRNAILFDPARPDGLGEALVRLCADPGLCARLGRAAMASIDEQGLTWRHNAARIVERVAARRATGPSGLDARRTRSAA